MERYSMIANLKVIQDMPHLRKKLAGQEERRMQRLKEAKENKDLRKAVGDYIEEKVRIKILNEKQHMAIHFLSDFVHNYSYKWIATRIGVEEATISRWRNDPVFLKELDRQIQRRKSFIKVHAFRNVHRAVIRGDMDATWKYLKMTGDLKDNVNLTVDETGEKELSDKQLKREIRKLQKQLRMATVPSMS